MNIDELLAQRAIELEDDRRKVLVTGRYMRNITADCMSLLQLANEPSPQFFRFGDAAAELVERDPDGVGIRIFTRPILKSRLDRLANFVAVDKDTEKPARPPDEVVTDLLAISAPPLPVIKGVINAPIFSESGHLLSSSGYHPETGHYLCLARGLEIPEVPNNPTAKNIAAAKNLLLVELLGDFPLVDDADWAHAIALLLERFVRPLVAGLTPLYLIESPTPGTGKGLLAEVLALPSLGHGPSVMAEGSNEDEWRKRLTAKLVEAPQFVLIDNVGSGLDSAALSAALTAGVWEDRILGLSRMVTVPVTCTWMATANNPTLSIEIARRTVSIHIDGGVERPWEKDDFRHSALREWAADNRGDLIWAALTLVQSWVANGMPLGEQPLGSFERWAAVLGGILDVAGIHGFLGDRERVYAGAAKETVSWAEFCAVWWEEFRGRLVGSDLLFEMTVRKQLLLDADVWGGRDNHSARTRFGLALGKMRDRVVGDYRVRRDDPDPHSKGQRFHLELRGLRNVAEPSPAPESAGPSSPGVPTDIPQEVPTLKEAADPGRENVPQPSATPRGDPWDPFLDEEKDGSD